MLWRFSSWSPFSSLVHIHCNYIAYALFVHLQILNSFRKGCSFFSPPVLFILCLQSLYLLHCTLLKSYSNRTIYILVSSVRCFIITQSKHLNVNKPINNTIVKTYWYHYPHSKISFSRVLSQKASKMVVWVVGSLELRQVDCGQK